MNELQVFKNEQFGSIRTIEKNGEPWFVGKDVATVLGYANPRDALSKHVDGDDKGVAKCDTLGGNQNISIINESGLYSLIMGSKLPDAKKFKHWVTSEVLPTIRRHGAYMTEETLERAMLNPDYLLKLTTRLKEETDRRKALEAENEQQKQLIADFVPMKQYIDEILSSTSTVTITQIAADYNLSAVKLNKILHEERVQHNVCGQWILYRKHMGKGYTKSETIRFAHSDGREDFKMQTKWTQKGRLMIHEILSRRGIRAAMDKEHA